MTIAGMVVTGGASLALTVLGIGTAALGVVLDKGESAAVQAAASSDNGASSDAGNGNGSGGGAGRAVDDVDRDEE
jgi:hypothetical protein